jgi:hypothetical protein
LRLQVLTCSGNKTAVLLSGTQNNEGYKTLYRVALVLKTDITVATAEQSNPHANASNREGTRLSGGIASQWELSDVKRTGKLRFAVLPVVVCAVYEKRCFILEILLRSQYTDRASEWGIIF